MFTYSVQLAGYAFGQKDDRGPIDLGNFKKILVSFPWTEQLQEFNEIRAGASATISAINNSNNTVLWVSVSGTLQRREFLIGYVFNKPLKSVFGYGSGKVKRWVDIYVVASLNEIIIFFELFFSGKNKELSASLTLEERIDSMAVPV